MTDPGKQEEIREFARAVASRGADVSIAAEKFLAAHPMVRDEYSFHSSLTRFVEECPPQFLKGFVYREDPSVNADLERQLHRVYFHWMNRRYRNSLYELMKHDTAIFAEAIRAYAAKNEGDRARAMSKGRNFVQQLYIHAFRTERAPFRAH